MIIATVSDIHLSPGDIFPHDLRKYDMAVLVGDIINIIPYGMWAWRQDAGQVTINSIAEKCPSRTIIIMGNHEGRVEWMEELFDLFECVEEYDSVKIGNFDISLLPKDEHGSPTVYVDRNYDIQAVYDGDRIILFRHGHQFAPDWKILFIGADDVNQFMTSGKIRRKLWYWWWLRKRIPKSQKNPRDYSKWYHLIWHKAQEYAISYVDGRPVTLYIGHTHCGETLYNEQTDCEIVNLDNNKVYELEI